MLITRPAAGALQPGEHTRARDAVAGDDHRRGGRRGDGRRDLFTALVEVVRHGDGRRRGLHLSSGGYPLQGCRTGVVTRERNKMINEYERRVLDAMERYEGDADPSFAHRLAAAEPRAPWLSAGHWLASLPVLIVAVAAAIVAFLLNVSSLALLFLAWAGVAWLIRSAARRHPGRRTRGPSERRS